MTKKSGPMKANPSKEQFLHDALLAWFATNRRCFPWREGQIDPFVSLVTELLLQRTRAEVVATFYPVILEHLSTPGKIVERDRTTLVSDLSALGLQDRRTDALKAIASVVQDEHGGMVPPDEEKLLALSGIGPYIARAVLCFAFGMPVSIVDGNVTRVFCRFFGIEDKGDNRRNKAIWEKADEIIALDPTHVKEFNWAVLDYGAMVCVPRRPGCDDCCLREKCLFCSRRKEKE
jgi:A/G-specific adenine glycosylase